MFGYVNNVFKRFVFLFLLAVVAVGFWGCGEKESEGVEEADNGEVVVSEEVGESGVVEGEEEVVEELELETDPVPEDCSKIFENTDHGFSIKYEAHECSANLTLGSSKYNSTNHIGFPTYTGIRSYTISDEYDQSILLEFAAYGKPKKYLYKGNEVIVYVSNNRGHAGIILDTGNIKLNLGTWIGFDLTQEELKNFLDNYLFLKE